MFKNYLKTTIRNLWRNKGYSFLNIFGLAAGIACAALIFLWVEDERNYDNANIKKDRIYAVANNQDFDGKVFTFNGVNSNATPGPLALAIKTEIPGVVNTGRISHGSNTLFTLGDKSVYENGCYIDSSLFSMFTIAFIQGKAIDAFRQLYSIVITEKMAKHFFADGSGSYGEVVGKTLKADNDKSYVVTGVIKDLPENSSIRFEWIAPFEIFFKQNSYLTSWQANSINTFVELLPSANIAAVNKQLFGLIQTKEPASNTRPFLFSMNDWRLRDRFENGKQVGGRIEYVHMFTIIAWIILLIACINFMNLATARSEKRAKEVGVRKVMGARRAVLIAQFIGEALCMAALAVVAGIAIVIVVLPFFNTLVEKQLVIGLGNPLHIAVMMGIAVVSGLIAGSYPALYLSSFNPVYVFKGIKIKNGSATFVRKGLVVFQFTISIVLIIGSVIIYQQIQHIKSRDLGYNRNNLLTMPVRGDMLKNYAALKQDMLSTGAIQNIALNSMNTINTGDNGSVKNLEWQGKNPNLNVLVSFRSVSPGFIATTGMKMTEGREFINEITDSSNVMVTQSFAALMGGGNVVGKVITAGNQKLYIIGVVKDFIYGDMYGRPDPVVFSCMPNEARLMYVRLNPRQNTEQALGEMKVVIKKYNPAYPFEYSFVDDQFNRTFSGETLIGKLSRIFAVLAIIISCLGLFGLAAYTAGRRTKEIGIRKVLGASVTNVTGLLSKEFLQLVFISAVIAFPIAWWAMNTWLQNYAYRVNINWWVFAIAGIAAIAIALITVSFQAIKAAIANPVKSLRTE